MNLDVTFLNIKPREEVRRRSAALYKKLERFLDPAATAKLQVAVEHGRAILELVIVSRGQTYKAEMEDEDLRTSIDRVFHNMEESLRRGKGRRDDRHTAFAEAQDGFEASEG